MASSRPLIGRTIPPHPAPLERHLGRHKYFMGGPGNEPFPCCKEKPTHPIHTNRFHKRRVNGFDTFRQYGESWTPEIHLGRGHTK